MVALFGVLSFFGIFVSIIMIPVNAARKKSVKLTLITMAISFVTFIICFVISSEEENIKSEEIVTTMDKEITEETAESEQDIVVVEEKPVTIEYDTLQMLFLELDFSTTEEDVIRLIENNDLEYTANEYNGNPRHVTYKIAYDSKVALQKYADSGNHIEVSFSQEDGSFMNAEYFDQDAFKAAILYNYGIYWDFREEKGDNEYSGYYYHTPGDEEGGITIEYSNGRKTETGYYNVDSGEEALQGVLSD